MEKEAFLNVHCSMIACTIHREGMLHRFLREREREVEGERERKGREMKKRS